jgi:hypothetical protein
LSARDRGELAKAVRGLAAPDGGNPNKIVLAGILRPPWQPSSEDLKMKLEELYANNPNVTRGVVRTSSILKSLHLFLLTGKSSLKTVWEQSKDLGRIDGAIRRPS